MTLRLRELRTARGLTQEAVAAKAGTTQGCLSAWERGRMPLADALPGLAEALGVTVDELFADDDEGAA